MVRDLSVITTYVMEINHHLAPIETVEMNWFAFRVTQKGNSIYIFLTPSYPLCSIESLNYNLVSLCGFFGFLMILVVTKSPPPPFRTSSKLADCLRRTRPSESANCNTRLETVGLSRL